MRGFNHEPAGLGLAQGPQSRPMATTLPFLALALAGLAWWCQRRPPEAVAGIAPLRTPSRLIGLPAWALCWVAAAALGGWSGLLDAMGVAAVAACIGLSCWGANAAVHRPHRAPPRWMPWVVGAFALALALHAVPGFHNPLVLDQVQWRPGDPAFSLRASFDKANAALMLWVMVVPRGPAASWGARPSLTTMAIASLTTALTLGLGWAWGLTEPASSWPQVPGQALALPLFLLLNLFVTCLAEEAFFRGLLQTALMKRLSVHGWGGRLSAIALPAALFGLAHLGGGPQMAALATLVGLGSGWVFARTRCIEAAVLTHFTVNAVHLLAFTYPARLG